MVVKINSKPIQVKEEDAEERTFDPVYLGVSCVGYMSALWVLDYCCFVFFSVHPLPFVHWFAGVLSWLF